MLRTVTLAAITVIFCVLATLVLLLPTPGGAEEKSSSSAANSFAITGVRLFDGEKMIARTNVVVRDGKIAALGPDVPVPDGMTVIDGAGHTVLPGLIDAHTHVFLDALRDALRFGVTAELDMFTDPTMLSGQKKKRAALAETQTADLFSAGMLATAPRGHGTQFGVQVETLTSPAGAADWVARRIREGSEYIKIIYMPYQDRIPSLDRATAAALIRAAHEQGVMAVAHISSQRGARDMIEEGVDGLVHMFADSRVTPEFAKEAARRKIFFVTTLTVIASADGRAPGRAIIADKRLEPWLTPGQKQSLSGGFGFRSPAFQFDHALHNTLALHKAGVDILAGSDAPNPGTAHGASLHQELAFLVEAGLTPLEALRAATSLPARRFGLDGRGIKVGARADLVLVKGNPERDIAATRAIVRIFKNGFAVSRELPEAPPESPPLEDPVLGTFETGLSAPEGLVWAPTTDKRLGGASEVRLTRVEPGADGSAGAMGVVAQVRAGFIAPWAGAFLGIGGNGQRPFSLAAYRRLSFQARGTQGTYRVMMFNPGAAGAPATRDFQMTESWRTITMDLKDFQGFSADAFAGFAIVAGPNPGEFRFEIDNVRLE